MANKPLTANDIVAAFEHWRVPYHEVSGWRTRSNGNRWTDQCGLMYHHTAGSGSDAQERSIITNGHSSLRGPLAQFGVRDDGVIDIIAVGPANHAGGGDPAVLTAVRRESYGDYPPKTTKHHGEAGAVGGNGYFLGWESYYGGPGDREVNVLQHRVAILSMAAITWACSKKNGTSWTAKSTIGHKEWSDWKSDPHGVDMKQARQEIQWCLDNGPTAAYTWYATGKQTNRKDWLAMATEQEVRTIVREEIRAALTEWPAFRTHDTYDAVTGERLENVDVRKGTLEYALWCAVRDARQGKDIALEVAVEGAPIEKAVAAAQKRDQEDQS